MENLQNYFYHVPEKCDKCGGELEYIGIGEYKCRECGNIMRDDFGKVRHYLESHEDETLLQVSKATGIDKDEIEAMVRDERLEISKHSKVFFRCKACGKPITTGIYCPECAKLAKAAQDKKIAERYHKEKRENMQVFSKPAIGETGKMRFRIDDFDK